MAERRSGIFAIACVAGIFYITAFGIDSRAESASAASAARTTRTTDAGARASELDRSGRTRIGKASFYAQRFAGRKMADGARMDPRDKNAASKTLPLGTTAKVTNLENGESTVVNIQDRGPYVGGRIVDLSPATAAKIGIGKQGVARVAVAPIAVPLPNGDIKLGSAVREPQVARDNAARPDEHSGW